jgi:hypothetical protein
LVASRLTESDGGLLGACGAPVGARTDVAKMVLSGGLEVAVEHGGVEVQAVGPCHGAAFWINLDLREVQRIVKRSEDPSLIDPAKNSSSLAMPSSKVIRITWSLGTSTDST